MLPATAGTERRPSPAFALPHVQLVGVENGLPLEAAPAVICETADPRGVAVVNLFPDVLAHIADPEVAVRPVEREAPRVAQPVAHDLPRRPGAGRIDAEQLAESAFEVLRAILWIAAGAAVA